MRVFVTGGTGLVGSRLIGRLLDRGDDVVLLTRRPDEVRTQFPAAVTIVAGDPMQSGPWQDALADCDGVVHLAGEGVFNRRWRAWFKELLVTSRVDSTRHVVDALRKNPTNRHRQPKVLVNASAIGYYGPHGEETMTEDSPPGADFLAQLCVDWEKAAQQVTARGVRLAILRVGVVLDPKGGALKKMLTPFKMFVGGPVGSGKQFMSWIHHEDMVGLILFALDNPAAAGPFNATAPNPVTNKQFSKALGRALHRPSFMWTPGFLLRIMLGQVANVVTQGQKVLPQKALELGYQFKFTEVDAALADIFQPNPELAGAAS